MGKSYNAECRIPFFQLVNKRQKESRRPKSLGKEQRLKGDMREASGLFLDLMASHRCMLRL